MYYYSHVIMVIYSFFSISCNFVFSFISMLLGAALPLQTSDIVFHHYVSRFSIFSMRRKLSSSTFIVCINKDEKSKTKEKKKCKNLANRNENKIFPLIFLSKNLTYWVANQIFFCSFWFDFVLDIMRNTYITNAK